MLFLSILFLGDSLHSFKSSKIDVLKADPKKSVPVERSPSSMRGQTIDRSSFRVSSSDSSMAEIIGFSTDSYQLLPNVEVKCGTKNILMDKDFSSEDEAIAECNSNNNCQFFFWNGFHATLCSEKSLSEPIPSLFGAKVYVKPSAVMNGLDLESIILSPNNQGICEAKDIIKITPGIGTLKDAIGNCRKTRGCTHFTLSTLPTYPGDYENTLFLCKGTSVKVPRSGYIHGEKIPLILDGAENISDPTKMTITKGEEGRWIPPKERGTVFGPVPVSFGMAAGAVPSSSYLAKFQAKKKEDIKKVESTAEGNDAAEV